MSITSWYLVLVILSILDISSKEKLLKSFAFYITTCSILIFIGFGYKIGVDWPEYLRIFKPNVTGLDNYEKGYLIINKIAYSLTNFWFFIILIKLTYVTLLISLVHKYANNPTFALTLIIGLLYPFMNDPIRQLIVIIVFYSFFIFKNRGPKIIATGIMSTIHASSIFLLSIYTKKIATRKTAIMSIILVISLLVFLKNKFLLNILQDIVPSFIFYKIELYISHSNHGNLFALLFRLLLFTYIVFSKKITRINTAKLGKDTFITFWSISLIVLLLEIVAFQVPLFSQRIRLYLIPFPLILFANYIYCNLNLFKLTISISCLLFLLFSLHIFNTNKLGSYYSLDRNLLVQYILGFPNTSWEKEVWDFWRK